MNINKTRKIYKDKKSIMDLKGSPIRIFKEWYMEAEKKVSEPNAFALSTCYKNTPSSRMMLLKDFSSTFIFYANISSKKGVEIRSNKSASILFWWKEIQKQVRIEGQLSQLSKVKVKKYFYTRPLESQIGALSSNQSSTLNSYDDLVHEFEKNKSLYKNKEVPFPVNWVGFELRPKTIEFWQGGTRRLHQRIEYSRHNNAWRRKILAP